MAQPKLNGDGSKSGAKAHNSSSGSQPGSVLRPLRSAILELLKVRQRAELHADSQVTLFLSKPSKQVCKYAACNTSVCLALSAAAQKLCAADVEVTVRPTPELCFSRKGSYRDGYKCAGPACMHHADRPQCWAQVCIREASAELYAAVIDEKLAMKIGPGSWEPPKSGFNGQQRAWRLAVSGPGFSVWEVK